MDKILIFGSFQVQLSAAKLSCLLTNEILWTFVANQKMKAIDNVCIIWSKIHFFLFTAILQSFYPLFISSI